MLTRESLTERLKDLAARLQGAINRQDQLAQQAQAVQRAQQEAHQHALQLDAQYRLVADLLQEMALATPGAPAEKQMVASNGVAAHGV